MAGMTAVAGMTTAAQPDLRTGQEWSSTVKGMAWRQSRFDGLIMAPTDLMQMVDWVMEGLDFEPREPSVTQAPGHFIGLIRYLARDPKGRPLVIQIEVIGGVNLTRLLLRAYAGNDETLTGLHGLVHQELALRLEVVTLAAPAAPIPVTVTPSDPIIRVSGVPVEGTDTGSSYPGVGRSGKTVTG